METAWEILQMAFEQVTERPDDQDARDQPTSSQLHHTIKAEGKAAMARDKEIGRELLDQRNQHQEVLGEHGQAPREVIQELRESKEERRLPEGRLTKLSELIISLNSQVKGKRKQSDPTPEPSAMAACGGNGGNRPPPSQQAAPGAPAVEIVTMMKKDREKKDGMRDLREEVGGQMMMMVMRRMNRRQPMREDIPELWGKPSGKPPNGWHKPHRNTNTPNTRILGFGSLPARISLIAIHTNSKLMWNRSNTLCPS